MNKFNSNITKFYKKEEVNYKKNFCIKYFDKGTWDLDVLNEVDVLLKDKKENILLYIESKFILMNESEHKKSLAQVVITNKKQKFILNKIALIYQNSVNDDILELIDCSDDSIMYNNDINWKSEKASSPSKDAIDRINDRIKDKITVYKNEEIKEFYTLLKKNQDIVIDITEKNFNVVYNQWRNEIKFKETIKDEQEFINLFLVDVLNNTKYKKKYNSSLFKNEILEQDLINEGTNLSQYELRIINGDIIEIKYTGKNSSYCYTIQDFDKYSLFWRKYKRPPEETEFLKILEYSGKLYSEKYRKDTGGEYTPICFVEKQNEILAKYYNLNDYIIFDPCAGVGNLENQFGKDYKEFCYLSTLEKMDVDICKIKGFENSIQYDYLTNDEQPKFKYKGSYKTIKEIANLENRKIMVIMNPPYKIKIGFKNNLAIEFFNKVLKLEPQVIVFYYTTKSFWNSEIEHYINSNYKIKSHIFSNAKTTFKLSTWPISQVIFDKNDGYEINREVINADRYELEKENFVFKKLYTYNFSQPNLLDEIENKIKKNNSGIILGSYNYLRGCIYIGNDAKNNSKNKVTTNNLIWCLLSKGINFNTDDKYFERNNIMYKGSIENILQELFSDAIMFSLFYLNFGFTNKGQKNYIMPFTSEELGCTKNDLNVLYPDQSGQRNLFNQNDIEKPFDFRVFLSQFEFSDEAKELYKSALQIFKYYHQNEEYKNKDWNDSFYDITNTIMGKDNSSFKELETENDTRITKVKTTKGTKGFGRNTIKYVVNFKGLPIFENFFNARDILARKINKQLVQSGILLWERENIY